MRRSALLCSLLLLTTIPASALAPQSFSQLSAADLTSALVLHAKSAPTNTENYTFFILHRNLNYVHGIRTSDESYKSEQIYIGGLPYRHRIEYNGKPLKGKDLERESALYEKTLRERTGLTSDIRSKLLKQNTRSVQFMSTGQLASDFRPAIVGHPVLDGRPCILLDLTPLHSDAPPPLQRHILLTLDSSNLNILQMHIELLATDNGFRKGTTLDYRSTYIDGALLPAYFSVDTTVPLKFSFITANLRIVGTDEFSNYRRFTTSVTLKSTADADALTGPVSNVAPAPAKPQP